MSDASTRVHAGTAPRIERWQPWIAALLSALLHGLLLLIAMLSPPITVSTPQGAAAGGAVQVDFIGETPTHAQEPSDNAPAASEPAEAAPATPRIQPPPVVDAEEPVLPEAVATADAQRAARNRQSTPRPDTPRPAANPPPPTHRPGHIRGQPPGMLPEQHAPANAGPARSPGIEHGRRNDASSSEPNLEAGGYQVVYDLRSETRLRAWRDEGMTEIFIPLPGTRQLMVCPLETALRRGSGPCRLLAPNDPELANIGDAREVLGMQQVYRLGQLVWRGPGPYR